MTKLLYLNLKILLHWLTLNGGNPVATKYTEVLEIDSILVPLVLNVLTRKCSKSLNLPKSLSELQVAQVNSS